MSQNAQPFRLACVYPIRRVQRRDRRRNVPPGAAFLPDTERASGPAEYLTNEFGYRSEYIEDWQDLPAQDAKPISRSLIEQLALPARR